MRCPCERSDRLRHQNVRECSVVVAAFVQVGERTGVAGVRAIRTRTKRGFVKVALGRCVRFDGERTGGAAVGVV